MAGAEKVRGRVTDERTCSWRAWIGLNEVCDSSEQHWRIWGKDVT